MAMLIRTEIFPLRASLKKKDKWELIIELENEEGREKIISLEIDLPTAANFSTVGLSRSYGKQIDSFRAKGKAQIKIPVYISNYAKAGNHSGTIRVMEHFHDFDHVERTYTKIIPFRIVE